MKKDSYQGDIDEKTRLHRVLMKEFGIMPLIDETIFISKKTGKLGTPYSRTKEHLLERWWPHNPDMYIKSKKIAIEIDGEVHWQNSKAVKKTNERNEHYEKAGITLVWFTRDEVRKSTDEELSNLVANKMGRESLK